MPALECKFKGLQSKLHPDKFGLCSRKEQEASLASSSTVNQAYQLLRCDAERAKYLLRLVFGVDLEESRRSNDSQFMAQVFELRERIEDHAADRPALLTLQGEVREATTAVQAALERALAAKDRAAFEQAAVQLQYYLKISDELSDALDADSVNG